ncbi:hypothetical protein [Myxococcus sp. AB036A]|uniref:hypothetical protein n=1 Tax=Myxococcus sp. AB036A TaxID=2562793 RepID=UPI001146336F|nr:hypothetical protein [Myxococcus sp. AB036A]
MSAQDITLPSPVLSASAIELMGSGLERVFKRVPFAACDKAWPQDDGTRRTVFVMNAGGMGNDN